FVSSRTRHTCFSRHWSSDVCYSDLEGELDGLLTVRRLGDDLEVGLRVQHRAQPTQHDRVIVGDEDLGRGGSHRRAARGTDRRTTDRQSVVEGARAKRGRDATPYQGD